jgi:hypothetical protein
LLLAANSSAISNQDVTTLTEDSHRAIQSFTLSLWDMGAEHESASWPTQAAPAQSIATTSGDRPADTVTAAGLLRAVIPSAARDLLCSRRSTSLLLHTMEPSAAIPASPTPLGDTAHYAAACAHGSSTTLMQPSSLLRNVRYISGARSSGTRWVMTSEGSISFRWTRSNSGFMYFSMCV